MSYKVFFFGGGKGYICICFLGDIICIWLLQIESFYEKIIGKDTRKIEFENANLMYTTRTTYAVIV